MSQDSKRATAISRGLRRLRLGVVLCCWLAGVALFAQVAVWSLATFTDIRFTTPESDGDEPLIVKDDKPAEKPGHGIVEAPAPNDQDSDETASKPENERVTSAANGSMRWAHNSASAAARISLLVLLPLTMLGVVILSGSSAPGMEKTITALMWLVVVMLITLPVGESLGLPWQGGAISNYEPMTTAVDAALAGEQGAGAGFYMRYALLPAVCVVGLIVIGLRFCAGVELAILAGREQLYDPKIEAEASNVNPTSLHGGRNAGAFQNALSHGNPAQSGNGAEPPSAKQLSPGETPQRLI